MNVKGDSDPLDIVLAIERADYMRRSFNRLPEKQRMLLRLTCGCGLCDEAAAKVVGLRTRSAQQYMSQARKSMRVWLREQGY